MTATTQTGGMGRWHCRWGRGFPGPLGHPTSPKHPMCPSTHPPPPQLIVVSTGPLRPQPSSPRKLRAEAKVWCMGMLILHGHRGESSAPTTPKPRPHLIPLPPTAHRFSSPSSSLR